MKNFIKKFITGLVFTVLILSANTASGANFNAWCLNIYQGQDCGADASVMRYLNCDDNATTVTDWNTSCATLAHGTAVNCHSTSTGAGVDSATCVCDTGYSGTRCDSCASGYILVGGSCINAGHAMIYDNDETGGDSTPDTLIATVSTIDGSDTDTLTFFAGDSTNAIGSWTASDFVIASPAITGTQNTALTISVPTATGAGVGITIKADDAGGALADGGILSLYGGAKAGSAKDGYVRIGSSGIPTWNLGNGLFSPNSFELGGTLYAQGLSYFTNDLHSGQELVFTDGIGGNDYSNVTIYENDGTHFALMMGNGFDNGNLILTTDANKEKFHHRSTLSADPAFFIFSSTDVAIDSTQWMKLTHDKSNGVIDMGTGNLFLDTKLLVGSDANFTDFANAEAVISQGDTGATNVYNTGLVVEGVADGSNEGIGLQGIGKALANVGGFGLYGEARVSATGDTGDAGGVMGMSTAIHAGGNNVGIYSYAENGDENYSFYGVAGDIYNDGNSEIVGTSKNRSSLDPDISNNQWGSHSHNGENYVINMGANVGTGSVPTTNNNGLLIAPSEMTSSGTTDFATYITRTLNDPNASSGTDYFTGLLMNIIKTDDTGWDAINLINLQVDGASKFQVNDGGSVYSAGAHYISEIATPSAVTDFGAIYPKDDNRLYFQDGAGSEHKVALDEAWVDYSDTSTITGWSSYTVKEIWYLKEGNKVFVKYDIQGVSDSTTVTFTVPDTSANTVQTIAMCRGKDNGAVFADPSVTLLPANSATMTAYTTTATTGNQWTASGNKSVQGQFFYDL